MNVLLQYSQLNAECICLNKVNCVKSEIKKKEFNAEVSQILIYCPIHVDHCEYILTSAGHAGACFLKIKILYCIGGYTNEVLQKYILFKTIGFL